jgi:hypothetical protein
MPTALVLAMARFSRSGGRTVAEAPNFLGYPMTVRLVTLAATVPPTRRRGAACLSGFPQGAFVTPDLDALRLLGDHRVFLADDPRYDVMRAAWNLAVDQRPAAVVLPRTIAELGEVVRTAARAGLRVMPQGSGHGAGPFHHADLSDVILVRMTEFRGVEVDPAARRARVLAGTPWQDVIDATLPHGLTALHGSAADVGVAGYLLGGGLSFYARKHGLASDLVTAIDLIIADGELVHASAEENTELFWALRGAGGALGIAVAFEIDLLPYPDVYAGMLLWDRSRAAEVVRAWTTWTALTPDSVTTSLRLMSFPPLPELPPFLSGRDVVVIDGVVLETDEDAALVLEPLRAEQPELDTFARIPSDGVLTLHMDPPMPSPAVSDHLLLRELPEQAVAAFLEAVEAGGLTFGELRQLGGAMARGSDRGGQLSSVEAPYALFAVAMAPTPEAAQHGAAAARALTGALAPWAAPRLLPTFAENRVPPERIYGGDLDRLAKLSAEVDPDGIVLGNHPLRPTTSTELGMR